MNRFIYFLALILIISCKKDSGEGGTSVIEGKVYKIYTYQNITGEIDTVYYQLDAKKDVFIIYSDDESSVYDDNFETDYNGRYRFEYLRKGDYIVYTYADSSDVNTTYDYPVFQKVKISSNNSTVILDDFVIERNQ